MEQNTDNVFNFSAGPAGLPKAVMQQAQQELIDWQGLGTSVMEISHRSKEFIKVAEEAEQDLRDLLNIPDNYKVLFCQGGARAQFAAVPLNLLGDADTATYIDGGYWAESAVAEAKKYCEPDVFDAKTEINGKSRFYLQVNGKLLQKRLTFTSVQMRPLMVLRLTIFLSPTNRLLLTCLRQFFLVKSMCLNTV